MRRRSAIVAMLAILSFATARAEPTTDNPDLAPAPFPEFAKSPPAVVASLPATDMAPVLGKKVLGPNGKDVVGQIVDILVDKDGKPTAAVIDVGGFLGVGSRKIAVDWQSLSFRPNNRDAPISIALDREQVQAAPEYKESDSATAVIAPPAASDTPHVSN